MNYTPRQIKLMRATLRFYASKKATYYGVYGCGCCGSSDDNGNRAREALKELGIIYKNRPAYNSPTIPKGTAHLARKLYYRETREKYGSEE